MLWAGTSQSLRHRPKSGIRQSKSGGRPISKQTVLDNRTIEEVVAGCPSYEQMKQYIENLSRVMCMIDQRRRSCGKETAMGVVRMLSEVQHRPLQRLWTRRKEGAICWLCLNCDALRFVPVVQVATALLKRRARGAGERPAVARAAVAATVAAEEREQEEQEQENLAVGARGPGPSSGRGTERGTEPWGGEAEEFDGVATSGFAFAFGFGFGAYPDPGLESGEVGEPWE
jgi:hypothetical protein